MKQNHIKDEEIMDVMMRISRVMKRHMTSDSAISHLTLLQLETLSYLDKNPQAQMLDVSNYFQITKPTATSMLNKLVSLKLVVRKASELDRRIIHVNLSSMGKKLLDRALKKKEKKVKMLLSNLSDKDKTDLLRITNIIFKTVKELYEK